MSETVWNVVYFTPEFDACVFSLYAKLHQISEMDWKHRYHAYDFLEDIHARCASIRRFQLISFLETFPYHWTLFFADLDIDHQNVYEFMMEKIVFLIHTKWILKRFLRRRRVCRDQRHH